GAGEPAARRAGPRDVRRRTALARSRPLEPERPRAPAAGGGSRGPHHPPDRRARDASTVSLRCSHSVGAGFFVSDEIVLTNAHVACEGSLIEAVFPDGRRLAAEVVKKDDWLDLASFRVLGAKAKPLTLGDAARLQPGDKVVLIGSPQGLDF